MQREGACGAWRSPSLSRLGLRCFLTGFDLGLAGSLSGRNLLASSSRQTATLSNRWSCGTSPSFGQRHLEANVDFYSHRNIYGEPDLYRNTERVGATGYLTDLITEKSLSFVQKNAHRPFFLYVAYNAPHWPFQPPDRPSDVRTPATWRDGSRRDYALMVERIDDGIGQILRELDRHGLTRNTLVIFTNDNGGERFSRNTPFFNHKATLWEGGIRVPCLGNILIRELID